MLPPPSHQAMNNDLILSSVFQHVDRVDLLKCMRVNQVWWRTAAVKLYASVKEGDCEDSWKRNQTSIANETLYKQCIRHVKAKATCNSLHDLPNHPLWKKYPNLQSVEVELDSTSYYPGITATLIQSCIPGHHHLDLFFSDAPTQIIALAHEKFFGSPISFKLRSLTIGHQHWRKHRRSLEHWNPDTFFGIVQGAIPLPDKLNVLASLKTFHCLEVKISPEDLNLVLKQSPLISSLLVVLDTYYPKDRLYIMIPTLQQRPFTTLGIWTRRQDGLWHLGPRTSFQIPTLEVLHLQCVLHTERTGGIFRRRDYEPSQHWDVAEAHTWDNPFLVSVYKKRDHRYWRNLGELHLWFDTHPSRGSELNTAMKVLRLVPDSCKIIFHTEWLGNYPFLEGWIKKTQDAIKLLRQASKPAEVGWVRLERKEGENHEVQSEFARADVSDDASPIPETSQDGVLADVAGDVPS